MIYLLYGNNTYEMERGLTVLLGGLAKKYPDVVPERLDGVEVEPRDLSDILQGTNLFNERRIVILRSPSSHKALWAALEEYIERVSDTTDLIIIDSNLDKRTRTFKTLQKAAQAHEYSEFGPRNVFALETWVKDEAEQEHVALTRESVRLLIDRVGYDQWALKNAITKLALVEDASPERIRDLVEASPNASAFELFETALRKDTPRLHAIIADLKQTNDPHALVGLLGSQVFQLALVAHSSKSPIELGKLIGSSPYPLQKLSPVVRTLSKSQVRTAVTAIAECDRDLKRSVAAPWTLITRALLKIAVS